MPWYHDDEYWYASQHRFPGAGLIIWIIQNRTSATLCNHALGYFSPPVNYVSVSLPVSLTENMIPTMKSCQ